MSQLASEAPETAIPELVSLCDYPEIWFTETLDEGFAPVGPVAIDYLVACLSDNSKSEDARMTAEYCLFAIAEKYPETTDRFRAELVSSLEKYEQKPPSINGLLINELVRLKAVETYSLIESVYRPERVDLMMSGTLVSVQVEMGLKSTSDFESEELRVPDDAMPEDLRKLVGVRKKFVFAQPRVAPKGFGSSSPPKKSKKKSKKGLKKK